MVPAALATLPTAPWVAQRNDTRNSLIARVLSGQLGVWEVSAPEIGFKREPRHGVIGLGLQEACRDPSLQTRPKDAACAPVSSKFATSDVMKTVLPERASPVTAQADHRFEKRLGHAVLYRFHPPPAKPRLPML